MLSPSELAGLPVCIRNLAHGARGCWMWSLELSHHRVQKTDMMEEPRGGMREGGDCATSCPQATSS